MVVKVESLNTYDGRPYRCSRCGKEYKREAAFRNHLRFKCEPLCTLEDSFEEEEEIFSEIDNEEEDQDYKDVKPIIEDKKGYICPKCGKCYKVMRSLSRHKHHECGIEPRHICAICGRKFPHKFKLVKHFITCEKNLQAQKLL
ncbi:GSCOCG00002787001-RA-CDS [Cotesia congregata]|nr:GSCOCG00002787001-RA-CDS [Cotesia congregata]